MDTARDKRTLKRVDAEELWLITSVDQDGYICIGCRLKATPCSYNRVKKNQKRPYFRFNHQDGHEAGCFYEQDEKLAKEAKKQKISTPEGFPLSHPSVLDLTDVKLIEEKGSVKSAEEGQRIYSKSDGSPSNTSRKHNYSVKTINSIAKHYLKFPYDRKEMSLAIIGISGSNYSEVIKKLPDKIVKFQQKKMRYGRLYNYNNTKVIDSKIIVNLLDGCWVNNKRQNTYKVVINTTGWNQSKKDYILNCVSASQNEYKEDKRKGTFVFFIGIQNESNLSEFIVNDYRLFSCISY